MPGGRYPWAVRAGGPLLGGEGGPTPVFLWSPVSGQPLPSGTFTRASVATEFDGSIFANVISGAIRENSAQVGGGAKGYLSEPVATNLIPDSSDGTAASWNPVAVTVNNNGLAALGLNETSNVADAVFDRHVADVSISGSNDRTAYAINKAGGGGGRYKIMRGDSPTHIMSIDLQSGTITEDVLLTETVLVNLGNGNYLSALVDFFNFGTFVQSGISDVAVSGTANRQWTGAGEEILSYHIQFEDTVYFTSPIITSGGSGTRQADVLDSDVVIASEFGISMDITLPQIMGAGETVTLMGPDATATPILLVDENYNVIMDDGGTPTTIGTSSAGARITVEYGRVPSKRSGSVDGAPQVDGDAPGAGHEGDTFQIGCVNSVNQFRGIIHQVALYEDDLFP